MKNRQHEDAAHAELPRRSTALKRKHNPFFSPGTIAALVGFAILFLLWPLGLILIAAGLILDALIGSRFLCGMCGNRVEKTSNLCPTCGAALVGTKGDGWPKAIALGLVMIAVLLAGYALWTRTHPPEHPHLKALNSDLRKLHKSR